jgi:uncharacterized coiled-coil DUF342 family protein
MSAYHAVKQFEENLRLFGTPARSRPEKHNLYAGLANLAKEVEQLRRDATSLRQEVAQLRAQTQQFLTASRPSRRRPVD